MKDSNENIQEIASAMASDEVIVALRTAQQHQVQLTLLADQKANINIGFTLFLITLNQGQIAQAIGQGGLFRIGAILLFLSVATSLLLALTVVLPRTGKKHRIARPEQMSNPFYFGMFSQLKQDVYVDYLSHTLTDNGSARRLLAADIYQIGQVLRRKYRMLRLSYSFLAVAVVFAVILFCYHVLVG